MQEPWLRSSTSLFHPSTNRRFGHRDGPHRQSAADTRNLFALMSDGSDDPSAKPASYGIFLCDGGHGSHRKVQDQRGWSRSSYCACRSAGRQTPSSRRGATPRSKNDGVNFHIELTVTRGEQAHVFKFDCGDSHVTAAGKGLVRMRGSFEHLRKDQVSALGNVITDFVGDVGLILLREKR
jgi:hypothetical protein